MEPTDKKGYVYILVNPAFAGFVKIGKTRRMPEARARELSFGTGVPAPYAVAWDAYVSDCDHVERLIHKQLSPTRARNDREFFSVPLKKAISIISSIVSPFSCEAKEQNSESLTLLECPTGSTKHRQIICTSTQIPSKEELIEVAEDSEADRAMEPPDVRSKKAIRRIQYEVLIENPYKYTEEEYLHEVHVVRRKRTDLNIKEYKINRSPLVKKYGWGVHKNQEGKLALIPVESDKYQELQKSIKTTKSFRTSKT